MSVRPTQTVSDTPPQRQVTSATLMCLEPGLFSRSSTQHTFKPSPPLSDYGWCVCNSSPRLRRTRP
eukprot:436009-Amphidinium_carterae.2